MHIFAFVLMKICACYKEQMREIIDYVFFRSLHGLSGQRFKIAKTATGKACNECKTLGQLGLVCV